MKKRILTALFTMLACLCLCFGLAACGVSSVGGTYYLYENGALNKDKFITLKGGKWTDENSDSGEYEIDGDKIVIYTEFFGEKVEFTSGTVKSGELFLEMGGANVHYYKEGCEPGASNNSGKPSAGQYTVTLDPNGGKCDITKQFYAKGDLLDGLPTPTFSGYKFIGWYDATGNKYDSTSVMPGGDLRLTAHWEKAATTYSDDYVSFKPATDGWKSTDLQFLYKSLIDEAVYVEITSDDLSGAPGSLHNFTLRSVEGMEYSVKSGYTWVWYEDSAFSVVNGAQRFTLNYGSNPQFVAVSKDNVVIKTYLVDIYVLHDYYISLYDRLNAQKPYDKIRVIEGNFFPSDTEVKEREDFEYDCRVYYNSNTGRYEPFNYSEPIRSDWALYQRYKAISYTPVLNEGELKGDVSISPLAPNYQLPVPVRTGYDFLGWKLGDKYFTDQWGNSGDHVLTASEKGATLTATWAVKHFYHYEKDDTVYAEHVVPSIVYNDTNNTSIGRVEYRYLTDTGAVSLTDKNTYLYGEEYTISHVVVLGYTWYGWFDGQTSLTDGTSYTFTMGEKNFAYRAKIVFDQRLNHFEYTSTPTTCVITGVKSATATSLEVPEYVTEMKQNLFADCSALKSLTLPFAGGSATKNTFLGYLFGAKSSSYNEDYVPATLKTITVTASIGDYAFEDCSGLENVTIGSGVTSIGDGAFEDCSGLKNVTIGSGVTSIGSYAFRRCSGLTSITIPDSVTSIGSSAFSDCSELTGVYITDLSAWCGINFSNAYANPLSYAHRLYVNNAEVKTLKIPTDVKEIKSYVFYGCSGLTSVTIGSGVTSIGSSAFSGCSSIQSITIPDSVTMIGFDAFYNCSRLNQVHISDLSAWCKIDFGTSDANPLSYANWLYVNNAEVKTLEIPTDVKEIKAYAFYGCRWLTGELKIPESVTSIGVSAFSYCSRLTSVTIGSGVTEIGSAFYGCSGLTSVTIPDSVTSIGEGAFKGCNSIRSMTIPFVGDSRKTANDTYQYPFGYLFGTSSFSGASAVYQYYYGNSTSSTTGTTYYIPDSLKSVTVTSGEILYGAFSNCSGLESVTIGSGVTSIGNSAFAGCNMLQWFEVAEENADYSSQDGILYNKGKTEILEVPRAIKGEVTIPDSVTLIESSVFSRCDNLERIEVAEENANYSSQDGILYNKEKTEILEVPRAIKGAVTIPDSVTSIGEGAFWGCSSIQSMTIPFVGGSRKTANDTYQYPFGYLFGTSSFSGASRVTQYYYGNSTSSTTYDYYYIPDSLKSVTVTGGEILYGAFYNCSGLENVTIGSGVTTIGEYAFYNCSGLTSVTIGSGVTTIGSYAFDNCSRLQSVTIGSGVASIGSGAFRYCGELLEIKVDTNNPKYHVDGNCLIETESKTLIVGCKTSKIPDDGSVITIGEYAFQNCSGLTNITIPDSVTSIGEGAFWGCSSIQSMTIPFVGGSRKTANDTYQYPFGYLFGTSSFSGASRVTQYYYGNSTSSTTYDYYYIPDSLKSVTVTGGEILYGAFYNCSGLESITIPDDVTSIGSEAFYNCSGLTGELIIPDGVTSIGSYAFRRCSGLTSITIPDSVTSIGESAFSMCTGLTGVYITDLSAWCGINFSNAYANPLSYAHRLYVNNTEVKTLKIPDSVTTIGGYAFYNCSGLTGELKIPDGVTSIGGGAFEGCSELTGVYITDLSAWCGINFSNAYANPLYYAHHLYVNNTEVKTLKIPDSVITIGGYAFYNCSGLTGELKIPDGVTTIGSYAFYNCSGLKSVVWNAENCTKAGSSDYPIFGYCANLKTVTFGENVKTIPAYALYGCSGLAGELKIPDSVTSIGYAAFAYCSGLTSVTIGSGVTEIGSAFYGCSRLKSVTIGSGVTSIESYASDGCSGLQCVYYKGTPEAWNDISIGGYGNDYLTRAAKYYFSDVEPDEAKWQESENWWHYDDVTGEIAIWEKKS